ncbi:bifunctional riboflavin kinase/FAD synthetase [Chloroflexia bacterium SDU3-3]|nr:bifunctional riboflavin kinase/FAD synthetase [Chloroflexia bacterium SDU3-3]
MKLIQGSQQPVNDLPTVLTIGVFDGMHRGHQHLISSAVRRAHELGAQAAVLTFDPHPDLVIHPERKRIYLGTLQQRLDMIARLGADVAIVLPFTEATKGQSAQAFVEQITATVALRELWVGYDFALGRMREGNTTRLAELGQSYGFSVHPVAAQIDGDAPISSSRIRAALAQGDMAEAQRLFGHPFEVAGPVVQGDQRGRTIGFPTANVAVDELVVLPADGVYVCTVDLDGTRYGAVTNVGVRPTFDGVRRTCEAHLLDFSGDLYGRTIGVRMLHRLRGEQKFAGVQQLVAQIQADAQAGRAWLAQHDTTP